MKFRAPDSFPEPSIHFEILCVFKEFFFGFLFFLKWEIGERQQKRRRRREDHPVDGDLAGSGQTASTTGSLNPSS